MIQLYEHQKKAVEKLHNGSILVGDTGTGKSLTGLAYYFLKVCGGKMENGYGYMKWPKNLYIITTARKRDTNEWEDELVNFLLSMTNITIIFQMQRSLSTHGTTLVNTKM